MMKLLILSDNHGLTEELNMIKSRHEASYTIHCGDSELDYNNPLLDNMIKVKGNCDMDTQFPVEEFIEIDGLKLYMTHGHFYDVKKDLFTLSYRAEEIGADIICYGHNHIAKAEKINNKLFINPGSIYLSKSTKPESYAILEIIGKNLFKVTFYSINRDVIESLSYQGSLEI